MTAFVTVIVVLLLIAVLRIVIYHLHESDQAKHRRWCREEENAKKAREEQFWAQERKKAAVELEVVERLRQIPPSEWRGRERQGAVSGHWPHDITRYEATTRKGSVAVLVYDFGRVRGRSDGKTTHPSSSLAVSVVLDGQLVAHSRQSTALFKALCDLYQSLDVHREQPARDERARQAQERTEADKVGQRREREHDDQRRRSFLDKL